MTEPVRDIMNCRPNIIQMVRLTSLSNCDLFELNLAELSDNLVYLPE
jgi:hypothetical protein